MDQFHVCKNSSRVQLFIWRSRFEGSNDTMNVAEHDLGTVSLAAAMMIFAFAAPHLFSVQKQMRARCHAWSNDVDTRGPVGRSASGSSSFRNHQVGAARGRWRTLTTPMSMGKQASTAPLNICPTLSRREKDVFPAVLRTPFAIASDAAVGGVAICSNVTIVRQ